LPTSDATTRGIRIQVESKYVAERSDPSASQWFFAYHITISNHGAETVQLVSRHWIITDSNGEVQQVKGPGVVGEQPVLPPGGSFQYTSACPLGTAFGTMHGSFQMVSNGGDGFDAEVAPFALGEPFSIN
jgi:ApaG protein